MEDLPLGRIAALVPEFAMTDLPLGRTLKIKLSYLIVHFLALKFDMFLYFIVTLPHNGTNMAA